MGRELGAARIVAIAGYGIDQVREAVAGQGVEVVEQREQLGTAHAALQARARCSRDHDGPGAGDERRPSAVPRVDLRGTARRLAQRLRRPGDPGDGADRSHRVRAAWCATRAAGVLRVVEERDADARDPRAARGEPGRLPGARAATCSRRWPKIGNQNAQREYYLTDLVEIALATGGRVATAPRRPIRSRPWASTTARSSRRPSASCAGASTSAGCARA